MFFLRSFGGRVQRGSPLARGFSFRKRRYAGVVFTGFCDLWFSVFF